MSETETLFHERKRQACQILRCAADTIEVLEISAVHSHHEQLLNTACILAEGGAHIVGTLADGTFCREQEGGADE